MLTPAMSMINAVGTPTQAWAWHSGNATAGRGFMNLSFMLKLVFAGVCRPHGGKAFFHNRCSAVAVGDYRIYVQPLWIMTVILYQVSYISGRKCP
jgi:hypothetical protein